LVLGYLSLFLFLELVAEKHDFLQIALIFALQLIDKQLLLVGDSRGPEWFRLWGYWYEIHCIEVSLWKVALWKWDILRIQIVKLK
jgi:hypothetical protein